MHERMWKRGILKKSVLDHLQADFFAADEIETLMDPILFKQESGQTIAFNYFDPENVDKKLRSGKSTSY